MTGYRDEKETLRARVGELEGELAEAQDKIARLTGASEDRSLGEMLERSRITGGPRRYAREVELPFVVSDEGYEAIARLVRERLGVQPLQVGRSLTAPGVLEVRREGERTIARITGAWNEAGLAVASGSILATLFGALPAVGILVDAAHVSPMHAAWMIPLAIVGGGAAMRQVVKRRTERELERLRGTFESVLELAHAHAIEHAPSVRARVEVDAAATEEVTVEHARARARAR